jgi:hypothetical protein
MVVVFRMSTMPLGDAPTVWERMLMTPRGLVNRRNGAETALAGIGDSEIRCDRGVRVVTLPAPAESTKMRDCAAASTLSNDSSEN